MKETTMHANEPSNFDISFVAFQITIQLRKFHLYQYLFIFLPLY